MSRSGPMMRLIRHRLLLTSSLFLLTGLLICAPLGSRFAEWTGVSIPSTFNPNEEEEGAGSEIVHKMAAAPQARREDQHRHGDRLRLSSIAIHSSRMPRVAAGFHTTTVSSNLNSPLRC